MQVTFKNVSFSPSSYAGLTYKEFKAKTERVFKSDTKYVYEKFVKPLGNLETKPNRISSNGVDRKGNESNGSKPKSD